MPGKSRNNSKYTLGRRRDQGEFLDLTLPSGNTCQVRRPGVVQMIREGVLDNFDELTALVQSEHIEPKTPAGQIAAARKVEAADVQGAIKNLMTDKDKLLSAFHLVDKIVVAAVSQPPVWVDYQGADETDADFAIRQRRAEADEAVAVRDIDLDDKVFIVNWAVGGSSDLKSFREERDKLVDGVEPVAPIRVPAKRTAARTR